MMRSGQYEEIHTSYAFPFLTADLMAKAIEQSTQFGQDVALDDFRNWLQSQMP